MANIADKVAQIRQAIFGKDVRESIASGIEAINSEVVSTTARQNVIDSQEQSRISNETIRQSQEATRGSTFNTNEATRKSTFNTNETARQTTFDTNETARSDTFNTNETERDAVIARFKTWYNSSSLTGRLPFVIDGGNFGDSRTGATYDGGDFGDPR